MGMTVVPMSARTTFVSRVLGISLVTTDGIRLCAMDDGGFWMTGGSAQ